MQISIDKNCYSDFVNLNLGVFKPLKNFCNEKVANTIINKKKLTNGKLFPFPILFGVTKYQFKKIKNKNYIYIIFKKKKIAKIKILNFFFLDKKNFGKKLFQTNSLSHPGYKYLCSFYTFLDLKIIQIYKKSFKNKNFSDPKKIKKKLKAFDTVAGFHTRNVPHKGHEWIHDLGLAKCDAVLIHPLIGQFKSGEYKEKTIIKKNLDLIKIKNKKNLVYANFNSYPRYAGPREALLHAIVRRNYGCTHFLIGRDHAGYKNFYSLYESQNEVYKNQNKINIKIIKFAEPVICIKCKNVFSVKCKKCKKKTRFTKISGTKIRKYILNKKNIPITLMNFKISKGLNKKSLI